MEGDILGAVPNKPVANTGKINSRTGVEEINFAKNGPVQYRQ